MYSGTNSKGARLGSIGRILSIFDVGSFTSSSIEFSINPLKIKNSAEIYNLRFTPFNVVQYDIQCFQTFVLHEFIQIWHLNAYVFHND